MTSFWALSLKLRALGSDLRAMKVSDFFAQLAEKEQILNKINKFKSKARHQALTHAFECCANCGGKLLSHASSDYLTYTVLESSECTSCLEKGPTRLFTLN